MWPFAALLLIAGAIFAVLLPYLPRRPQQMLAPEIDPRLAELYDKRDMLYQAIRDARFDSQTGKLSQDDYEAQTGHLKQEAADVLKSIDEIVQTITTPELDAALETEIAAARTGGGLSAVEDDPLEAAILAARRRPPATNGKGQGDRFCGRCGSPLQGGDRFCGVCGAAVRPA